MKDITKRYSKEIQLIYNRLSDLERGKVYEITKVPGNPYCATMANDIRADLDKLLSMIENNEESAKDAFDKFSCKREFNS